MVAKYSPWLVVIFLPLLGFSGLAGEPPSPLELHPPVRHVPDAFRMHDRDLGASPETDLISESFAAFELGELFADTNNPEWAVREMTYALESFFFSGIELNGSPLFRARLAELLARIDLHRDRLNLFPDGDADEDIPDPEEPPLEALLEASLTPAEIDPAIEHLIQDDILRQHYDFPVYVNREVMAYISQLTTGAKRDQVAQGLGRLTRFHEMFQRIFREEGIPLDLIYFGLVESNFKISAYSRARAKGLWQFIQWTGRRYGLRVDWWVDERSDPEKATRAACRYMKDLYGMFGDWYLVLAAYNSGEGRIQRILNRHPDRDFWEMAEQRLLPRETRNYVPAILASIIVGKNPERFDIRVEPQGPWAGVTVEIPSPTDLRVVAETVGVPIETLQDLNPALRRMLTPPDHKTYPLRVPVDTRQEMLALLYDLPVKDRLMYLEHVVVKGDTLYKICRKYDVSLSALMDFNDIRTRRTVLRIGQVLQVPVSDFHRPARELREPEPRPAAYAGATYRVRRGDTLWNISRRTQVSVAQLMSWNNLASPALKAGQTLRLREPARAAGPAARAAAGGTGGAYRVKAGDTLFGIARGHGVTLDDLLAANGLQRNSVIKIGQSLRIPGAAGPAATSAAATPRSGSPRYHTVRKGETLSAIARHYGTNVASLKRANSLSSDRLQAGAQLVIPN